MIRLRTATVVSILAERPGALEVSVDLDPQGGGEPSADPTPAVAVAYPALVGPVAPGDRVILNTSAVALGLGTGGAHFVVAVEGRTGGEIEPGSGRTMKLRYTPHQVNVRAVEEGGGDHRARLREARGLDGLPVVWVPLHSMVGPAVAGARAAGARRVAYVMTGGAALAAPLSR